MTEAIYDILRDIHGTLLSIELTLRAMRDERNKD